MQILNQTTLEVLIGGQNYTNYVQFPFKVSNLLDEQLDEASLTLIGVEDKIFKPLTVANITVENGTKTQTYSMLVADDKADEIPSGSGRFKHELYLIEQTKFLECFVVRNLGFVNTISANYTKIDTLFKTLDVSYSQMYMRDIYGTIDQFSDLMQSPIYEEQQYYVPSPSDLVSDWESTVFPYTSNYNTFNSLTYGETTIVNNGVKTVYEEELWDKPLQYFTPQAGVCDITIKANIVVYNNDRPPIIGVTPPTDATIFVDRASITCRLYLTAVPSISKKSIKWNARTVVRRTLSVAETLRKGENPRFILDGDIPYTENGNPIEFLGDFENYQELVDVYPTANEGDIAWLNTFGGQKYVYRNGFWNASGSVYPLSGIARELNLIETPELQITQSTLREALKEVGKFIHAEPRLLNGNTITFDKLGSGEISPFNASGYASKSYQQGVDRYATNLYSTLNNFVNSINYANGVMVEPYSNGFKTVRTENLYVRLEDTNVHISTLYPIRAIQKLECGLAEGFANEIASKGRFVDITAFVYESAEYQRLSSYEGSYPMSKAWALYYTIGQNGIYGLNFKENSALFEAFNRYAIVNILNAVTGNTTQGDTNMVKLAFRITYEPIYSATAQQSKSYIGDLDVPATMVYNQGQNLVESHYYGENMKGAIARLGNVDKVQTYVKNGLFTPPQVGQILIDGNDEYYISAVATEYFPFYTKFSMSLSKDFNRYSDYVKVNSEKRMYEVSERQAFDSHITYKDYIVIGDNNYSVVDDGIIDYWAIDGIFQKIYDISPLSLAEIQGYDKNENALQKVALPIQKTALGNSALFTIKYKDNYSAGDNVVPKDGKDGENNTIINYWQNGVAYSDYFGNIEYIGFTLRQDGQKPSNLAEQTEIGNALPLYEFEDDATDQYITTEKGQKLWVKKGSTEIPTIDYQVDFVTNRPNIIIGSGLAKGLPLITGSRTEANKPKLYLLDTKINKFDKVIDVSNGTEWGFALQTTEQGVGRFVQNNLTLSKTFKSWAIVDGETNELLIGCNKAISTSDDIFDNASGDNLRIFIKHDIFKNKINN